MIFKASSWPYIPWSLPSVFITHKLFGNRDCVLLFLQSTKCLKSLLRIPIFLIDRLEKFKLITEADTITCFYDYLVTSACWKQFEKVITR